MRHSFPEFARHHLLGLTAGLILGAALPATQAWAQAGDPFPCDAQFYQIRVETSSSRTFLLRYPTLTTAPANAYASLPGGSLPIQLNALGFNSRDNYLYAMEVSAPNLYRLGQGGAELVGSIAGLTGYSTPTGAAFDEGGRFYLAGQGSGNITPSTIFRIDNIPSSGTSASLAVARAYALNGTATNFGDMAFSTVSEGVDGTLYGTTGTTHYRIQLSNAASTANFTTATVSPSVGGIGSAFFDRPSDSFFVFDNGASVFYRINNYASGTPTATSVAAIPPGFVGASNPTDGAQCAVAAAEEADINVRKTVSPTTAVTAGQTVTFTVAVGNLGVSPAQTVTIADPLPAGLTLVNSAATSGSYAGSTWIIPSLPSYSTQTLTLVALVNSQGTSTASFTNVASVTSSSREGTTTVIALPDPVPSNNSSTATVSVTRSANLAITKTNASSSLLAGQTTSYTITVANLAGFDVANAVLTDPATTGLDCTVGAPPSCTVTPSPAGGTCPTAGAAAGQLSIANLQSAGGVVIPALNVGGTMAFSVACQVTATGQ
jgi:uncharacterized repeat protein (TIGR01451 family)